MKMKILMITGLVFASANGLAEPTRNTGYKLVGDMAYSSFCKAVLKDDVALLISSLNHKVGVVAASRDKVLNKVLAPQTGVTCAGNNLMDFAKKRQADNVYAFLAKQH